MKKTTKTLALLLSAGFILVGCGQKDNSASTTTQAPTTQAPTTQAPTTQAQANESTATFEYSEKGVTQTLNYKYSGDDVHVETTTFTVDTKVAGKSIDEVKANFEKGNSRFANLEGVKTSIEVQGDKVSEILVIDYTKVDFAKLHEVIPQFDASATRVSFNSTKEELLKQGYTQK